MALKWQYSKPTLLLVLFAALIYIHFRPRSAEKADSPAILSTNKYTDLSRRSDVANSAWKPSAAWTKAMETGQKLVEMLNEDATCVEQSKWTDFAALSQHGWEKTVDQKVDPRTEAYLKGGYQDIWRAWELSTAEGSTEKVEWTHNTGAQPDGPDGKLYERTAGKYKNIYNSGEDEHGIQRGGIFAVNDYSPENQGARRDILGGDVVPLARWSDITFLEWANFCNRKPEHMQGLQVMARMNVATGKSKEVAFEALQKNNKALNRWNGRVNFDMKKDPEATAILGTPHGAGVVYFLAQHKRQLEWKTIKSISVFANADPMHNPLNLLFVLTTHPDAEQPEQTPQKGGASNSKGAPHPLMANPPPYAGLSQPKVAGGGN